MSEEIIPVESVCGKRTTADRRIIRTKQAVYGAVVRLLGKKHIDDITNTEIADLADINRRTLYNYYRSVGQVVDEIERALLSFVETAFTDAGLSGGEPEIERLAVSLADRINSNIIFFRDLARIDECNTAISKKIADDIRTAVKERIFQRHTDIDPADQVKAEFAINGAMQCCKEWLLGKGPWMTTEELMEYIIRTCFNLLQETKPGAEKN